MDIVALQRLIQEARALVEVGTSYMFDPEEFPPAEREKAQTAFSQFQQGRYGATYGRLDPTMKGYFGPGTDIVTGRAVGPKPTTAKAYIRKWDPSKTHDISPGYVNVLRALKQATPDEIEFWRHWYRYGNDLVVHLAKAYKIPEPIVAAMVAVMSPGMPPKENFVLVTDLLQGRPVHRMRANVAKAEALLQAAKLTPPNPGAIRAALDTYVSGPKVEAFYSALADPEGTQDEIVKDGHVFALWRGDYSSVIRKAQPPSRKEMAQLQADYTAAGQKFGLSPQEAQAVSWTVWREIRRSSRSQAGLATGAGM